MYALLVLALVPSQPPGLSPADNPRDPYVRFAVRNRIYAILGRAAVPLIDTYGDDGAWALNNCLPVPACCFLRAYNKGRLRPLAPRMQSILQCMAKPRHGTPVALFVINHVRDLQDADFFAAFMAEPLEYSLGLRKVEPVLKKSPY